MKFSLKKYIHLLTVILYLLAVSCSNVRFLKENQYLYTGAEVKIETQTLSKKEKKELKAVANKLFPKPNSQVLGLRPKLYIHNITKAPKKKKGIRNWLKYKIGEQPVLLEDTDKKLNRDIIENYAQNKGYFDAKVIDSTVIKNKKAKIIYRLNPGVRFIISDVSFQKDSAQINNEIINLSQKTLLKKDNPFDLSVIKAERQRIDNALKERGYYFFNSDNIIVQADSADYKVRLRVKLKDNTPALATERYFIDKIIVIPNFNIEDLKDGKYKIPMDADSLNKYSYADLFIIDSGKKFRRKTFQSSFSFTKGDLYNRTDHNLSLSRLSNLGVFKFVKNEFLISDSLNHKFDAYYLLTPRQFQSLRFEALGRTNSANYSGGEINLNWTHRNIFKAAEHLRMALYGEFDIQLGGPKDANNIIRTGAELILSVPRLWAPFKLKHKTAFIPRTNIGLGYELQSRTQLYSMNNFKASFGYNWKESIKKEHDLKIFDLTFVSPAYVTDKYESMMVSNEYLQRVVEQQLIFGPVYSYTFTNTMLPKSNTFYYKGTLDLAGTLFGLISGANINSGNQKKILGVPFSQYAKIENDFRFYRKMGKSFTAAGRIFAGLAYPYGNSDNIPFTKQFFSGGSNSVRAFRARTLGPGSFDPTNTGSSFFFDQSGDIRLELNAEIRAKLYQFIHLAVFTDAGNIWLVNEDIERHGAAFSKDFIHEIAIGGGIGLRLDFSILVLRLDLSMPFRVPYFAPDERWTFDKINFGDPSWRKDNLILNIAIGYPF